MDRGLAEAVAQGLGISPLPEALPTVARGDVKPEVTVSPALSLMARPGDGSVRGRKIAILVADGVDGAAIETISTALMSKGAVPRLIGARLGAVRTSTRELQADGSIDAMPSVLFDAVVVPAGANASKKLGRDGRVLEFVKDQYRHCKPMLLLGDGLDLLAQAGISNVQHGRDAGQTPCATIARIRRRAPL